MNETRVKRLASENRVELSKKMFKRFCRDGFVISDLVKMLAQSELKDENVLSDPDFNFQMGLPQKNRKGDLICVQTPDGKTVRIVGYIDRTHRRKS